VLTELFIDALYRRHGELNGMDWIHFVRFQLAAGDVHKPGAIRYFFGILDEFQLGYLGEDTVRLYLQDILRSIAQVGGPEFKINDILVSQIPFSKWCCFHYAA
jgi:hypothetical protein